MENLSPSPESPPMLKPLESPASSGWTHNQIGGCPSVLHHALHIHGKPRLSHDHLCSFKHFLTEEGVLILTSWPKCNTHNYTVLCNFLSGVHWCFPVLPIMVLWRSNTGMATLPEESPCAKPCSVTVRHHTSPFSLRWLFNPSPFHTQDIYLYLCKRCSLKVCPLIPELCWAFHSSEETQKWAAHLPLVHTSGSRTNILTSATKVEMDSLEEPQIQQFFFLQGETRKRKTKPFVAPKSSPGISDQHTCCYN